MADQNPVAHLLDGLDDATMLVGLGPDSRREVATKREADGAHVQVVTLLEAVEQAALAVLNNALLDANTRELATANGLARESRDALRAQAAAAASGSPYGASFGPTLLTGGKATVVDAAANQADAGLRVIRAMLACSQVAGTVTGGSAVVYVYHCAGRDDAYNASGAVLVGRYPIASGGSYAVGVGRTVPKGRHLRAQATNGGCDLTLDVA